MRRLTVLAALLVTAGFLGSCGGGGETSGPPASTKGAIGGTVTNANTGAPLDAATVTTQPATATVTTNSQGSYTIANVQPGSYTVNATRAGYTANATGANVVAGQTSSANVALTPQPGSIAGMIADATNGQPIAGATVVTQPATSSVTTNAQGAYSIPNVPAGQYTVTASMAGYNPASVPAAVQPGTATAANAALTPLAGTISGTVTDPGPVVGATVTTQPATSTATTNSQGAFTIMNVPAGTYVVQVSLTGYTTATMQVNVTRGQTTMANLSLIRLVTVTGIAPNGGQVSGGTVVTITGTGFEAGATVTMSGTSATAVSVANSTSISATAPARAAGTVDVVVTNTGGGSGTLPAGYNYFTPPTVKWTYDLGTRVQDNGSPVVASDGTIYVPSNTDFFAVNANGTLRWKKALSVAQGINWTMRNAPATSPDGSVVYAKSSWLTADTRVNALAAQTGAILWTYPLARNVSYSSFAVDGQGTIYIGTWGGSGRGVMFAINPDGTLKWQYDSPRSCGIQVEPAVEAPPVVDLNGNVYFVQDCIGLVALDSNGRFRWSSAEGLDGYGWPTPKIGPDGTVYVAGIPGGGPVSPMKAFDPSNGSIKWQRADIGLPGWLAGVAVSHDGSTVFSARFRGKVYALNAATGATRWVTTIADSDERFGGSPVLGSNGVLYIMGDSQSSQKTRDYVYAVSAATGLLQWSYPLSSPAFFWGPSSPALAPDGTLFVLSSGNLGILGGTVGAKLTAIVP